MMPTLVPGLTPLARVSIAEGSFEMGSTLFHDSQPVTEVTISAFEISETKVTIGQYREYLDKIGENRVTLAVENRETGDWKILARGKTQAEVMEAYAQTLPAALSPGARFELGGVMIFEVTDPDIPEEFQESLDQPVVKIDWWEILAFAAAHGGDLPTEVEYERVIRGKSGKDEYGTVNGDLRARDGSKLAQFATDRTSPVKRHPKGSWGVYDVSGNAWTWTKDWYEPFYKGRAKKDLRGPRQGKFRVLRGGACFNNEDFLHAAYRNYYRPSVRFKDFGGVVVWRSQDSK